MGGDGILVPNNRTDALLSAFAKADPADDPVLVFLSLVNGGVDGDMGIFIAEEGDLFSIGIEPLRGDASSSIKRLLLFVHVFRLLSYHRQIDWFQ